MLVRPYHHWHIGTLRFLWLRWLWLISISCSGTSSISPSASFVALLVQALIVVREIFPVLLALIVALQAPIVLLPAFQLEVMQQEALILAVMQHEDLILEVMQQEALILEVMQLVALVLEVKQ